jgi:hypothetical protein
LEEYFPEPLTPEPVATISIEYRIAFLSNLEMDRKEFDYTKLQETLKSFNLVVFLGNCFVSSKSKENSFLSIYSHIESTLHFNSNILLEFLNRNKISQSIIIPHSSHLTSNRFPQRGYYPAILQN